MVYTGNAQETRDAYMILESEVEGNGVVRVLKLI
jgi:hypothetical protein